eukprot:2181921-Amphidinium_carterae.4
MTCIWNGPVTLEDFQGNQDADVVANLGGAEHQVHEPSADYLCWEQVAQEVRNFWLNSGRPEAKGSA